MSRNEDGFDENGLLENEVELWRNAEWRVTSIALEEVSTPKSGGYWIGRWQLHWDMWPEHMAQKSWVNVDLFNEAFAKARELHPQERAA